MIKGGFARILWHFDEFGVRVENSILQMCGVIVKMRE
jgi:hypothetical protein